MNLAVTSASITMHGDHILRRICFHFRIDWNSESLRRPHQYLEYNRAHSIRVTKTVFVFGFFIFRSDLWNVPVPSASANHTHEKLQQIPLCLLTHYNVFSPDSAWIYMERPISSATNCLGVECIERDGKINRQTRAQHIRSTFGHTQTHTHTYSFIATIIITIYESTSGAKSSDEATD